MKFDDFLEELINAGYNQAKYLKHEYFTPEHILYASLFYDEGIEFIVNCGGDINQLKIDLESYFEENFNKCNKEVVQSVGLQNILSSTVEYAYSAGKEVVKFENLMVCIYDSEEYFASYFLRKQGITRLDILNYIAHGISTIDDGDNELSLDYEDEKLDDKYFDDGSKSVSRQTINISDFAVELTKKATDGKVDPLIGREDILKRTIQVLCRRLKNNPIHVGEPGVGKTAITNGLAKLIVDGKVPEELRGSKIYSLDMGSLLAGTKYRGDFEERVKSILNKIQKEENAIVYIDEIHTIVGAGAVSGGAMDASNILKPFLAEGKLKVIGSTTYDEYKKFFEKDKALSRRFQKIEVSEPTKEDTYKILLGLKNVYEEYHKVIYTNEALRAAVDLSHKYINERYLPDKAIDLIDEAGAYIKLDNLDNTEVVIIEEKHIEKVVSNIVKIPEKSVSNNDIEKLKNLDMDLKEEVLGQDKAIEAIVTAIKRSKVGFSGDKKPISSLLFVGTTGVGKTELSKKLAETMGIPLVRFDMSEYQEKHSVARLIGAPPGYVGYEEGGLLIETIRKKPHCVLLLDEIEKAHPDILNLLLQVMDYATITDSSGRKADFTNAILIMTSNAGAKEVGREMLGFGSRTIEDDGMIKEVEKVFSPEFRNRLDDIIIFNKISEELAINIAKKVIYEFKEQLAHKNVYMEVTEECLNWIAKKGFSKLYGAREIRRVVDKELKGMFVDQILFGKLSNGGKAIVCLENGELSMKVES